MNWRVGVAILLGASVVRLVEIDQKAKARSLGYWEGYEAGLGHGVTTCRAAFEESAKELKR